MGAWCISCGAWVDQSAKHKCPGKPLGSKARADVQRMIDTAIMRLLAELTKRLGQALARRRRRGGR